MDKTFGGIFDINYGKLRIIRRGPVMFPKMKCGHFDNVETSFVHTRDDFDKKFSSHSLSWYRMLDFDPATGTEIHYMCIDNQRIITFVDYIREVLKIPIPTYYLKYVFMYWNIINFINLTLRYEGFFVTSGSFTLTTDIAK
jgi:hypothetical protein